MTTLRFYRKRNTSDASDIFIQVIFVRQLETDHKNDINSSLFKLAVSDCYHECITDEFRCKTIIYLILLITVVTCFLSFILSIKRCVPSDIQVKLKIPKLP